MSDWEKEMSRDMDEHPEWFGMVLDDHGNPVPATSIFEPVPTKTRFRRLKDVLGFLLGYAYCRTCGRTMWRFDEGEWQVVPTEKFGVGKNVCRQHLR